jgi:hypothetical protein
MEKRAVSDGYITRENPETQARPVESGKATGKRVPGL